jgi:hypothetical protein
MCRWGRLARPARVATSVRAYGAAAVTGSAQGRRVNPRAGTPAWGGRCRGRASDREDAPEPGGWRETERTVWGRAASGPGWGREQWLWPWGGDVDMGWAAMSASGPGWWWGGWRRAHGQASDGDDGGRLRAGRWWSSEGAAWGADAVVADQKSFEVEGILCGTQGKRV